MRVSLSWLKQLVQVDESVEAIENRLSMAGFEVEEIDDLSARAKGVVVGHVLEREQLPQRVAELAPYFEGALHQLKGGAHITDIRNYGFAGALTLASYPGEPARRPYEVAMRMWEKGFYVRYGGDTIQLGLPFVIEKSEIDSLVTALGESLE